MGKRDSAAAPSGVGEELRMGALVGEDKGCNPLLQGPPQVMDGLR